MACLLLLLGGFIFSLRYKPVQTYFAQKAAAYLSKELNTEVSLQGIYFHPFSSLVLDGLYIEDQHGDTLLYAGQLKAALDLMGLRNNQITVNSLRLSDSRFFLKKYDDGNNLSFLTAYFSPASKTGKKKQERKIRLNIGEVRLHNAAFAYQNQPELGQTRGINYSDLYLSNIGGHFSEIDFENHLITSRINSLTFKEKSGFHLKEMNTIATVDTNRLELRDLYLESNRSRIRDYLLLTYRDFSQFKHFIDSVSVVLSLRDAYISSKDIAYFAPSVSSVVFDVNASGKISGTVSDISGEDITLRTGNSTALQGDLTIKGLPDINTTFFDMELGLFTTNSQEIEQLVPQLGNISSLELPAFFDRIGNVNYQGTLTGLYNDFAADGTLQTELGIAQTTLNLSIQGKGEYQGVISSADYQLGKLLQNNQLGQAGFDLTVEGEGFTLENMDSEIHGRIDYLDFNAYRYNGLLVQGKLADRLFAGNIAVNDPNLRLHFDGKVNFNPELPEYHFSSDIKYADLHTLHLYAQDTVIIHDAFITGNFSGNTLNNIQGDVRMDNVVFSHAADSFAIQEFMLFAAGNEDDRRITLSSDILDGTLYGVVNFNTLGSYFKSAVMRYMPYTDLQVYDTGRQAFEMDIVLKDFRPIAPFVSPNLAMEKGMRFNGHFSSADSLANFNLLVPHLNYKNLHIEKLVVAESTDSDSLHVLTTATRISLGDSLYVTDASVASTLVHDNLQFNISLSNKAPDNQLNLNGLAKFSKNEPTKVSFLPSVLVINQVPWKLSSETALYIGKDNVFVEGLQLSENGQKITLNGAVSSNEEDKLNLRFENFDLNLLNAFTSASSMEFEGIMNGHVDLSSLLKNPFAAADLEVKDIYFNKIPVGDLSLKADYDPNQRLVNMALDVVHEGIQTIKAGGTYNAAEETDKLNLNINFNKSELVIFQPFLGKLVSNLTGNVSAQLNMRGSFLEPRIDGTCHLHDAGFIVNYLQTPYRVNDKVTISNSTIIMKDMEITDPRNHKAVVNGRVDMQNLLVPHINATIEATNFLVLNTTYRDNPLYYGRAYGTGSFAFNGPTNAIDINIKAQTDEGTNFSIPFNVTGTVSDNDFITFTGKDSLAASRRTSNFLQGMTMHMDLLITPQAEANLYTDLGELSGRGEGLISLNISSLGDFGMFGDYVINSGKFTFTAQDFINKIFEINRGGTIRWTGQPTEAVIKLTAVYEQRTSVAPLYNAAGGNANEQRVLAQAEMNLNGNLMRPDITFGLNFPNEPYIKDELQSYLSDVNNINQQALSLIIRRSFAPGSSSDFSRELNSTLLSAGTELAFNQLNNIIAQSLNLKFVDLNIRSLNEASASLRFFNDRLIFTGGVTDRRNLQLHDFNVFGDRIATDAELLYLIHKDGRLVLRGSNRLNTRNFLLNPTNDEYVSALGLIYRQEFYSFSEFFRRLTNIRKKEEEEE